MLDEEPRITGLAPRARRDIAAAVAAGWFTGEDTELALAVAGGALLGLGNLLRTEPERDDARAADAVTENILRIFGVSSDEAHALCERPLLDLSELQQSDSVA